EFGGFAQSPAPILAAISHDRMRWVWGGDPVPPKPTVPSWAPTNMWCDNYFVIGQEFDFGTPPKLRLDYKDDIELYDQTSLTFGGGGRWFDALSSRAIVVANVNSTPGPTGSDGGAPTNSIRQENFFIDSIYREEFSSDLPGFDAGSADQRPVAQAGAPIRLSADVRLANATTGRAIVVDDNDVAGAPGFGYLLLGASNLNQNADGQVYIRLDNPAFDPLATGDPADEDEQPELTVGAGKNVGRFNYPTTSTVAGLGFTGAFRECALVVRAGGWATWEVNGVEVRFDAARIAALEAAAGLGAGTLLQPLIDAANLAGRNPAGPYAAFPVATNTMDDVEFWSGNQASGNLARMWVDDLCVIASPAPRRLGPVFESPYWDSFDCYVTGQSIEGQGDTPFADLPGPNSIPGTITAAPIDVTDLTAKLPPGPPYPLDDYCVYEVVEVIPQVDRKGVPLPDQWGIGFGDQVYARIPATEPGFACPQRPDPGAGLANLVLRDHESVMSPRRPALLRVEFQMALVGDNAIGADAVTYFDRYEDGDRLFCRYQLAELLTALEDPSMSGAPGAPIFFDCPDWELTDVIAVDAGVINSATGALECHAASGNQAFLSIFDAMGCENCEGSWVLLNGGVDGMGFPTGEPSMAQPGDIRGYSFRIPRQARWEGVNAPDNGLVVVAPPLIDPNADFGETLRMRNNGAVAGATQAGTLFGDVDGILPRAEPVDSDDAAGMFVDVFVEDLSSRIVLSVIGDGGLVTAVRLGGPDPVDGVAPGNFGIEIADPMGAGTVFMDSMQAVPVGQWFRLAVDVDVDGNFRVGLNASGTPGDALDDCFENFTMIASGFSADMDSEGLPVNDIFAV
ncbi:MAG: hypothetical protein VYC34_06285, partial [Planctomycetota bacterium]|nr:hypothetical protein [Planctomycetota bacterium]